MRFRIALALGAPALAAGCGSRGTQTPPPAATTTPPATTAESSPSLDPPKAEPDSRKFTDAELAQRVRRFIHDAQCFDPADVTRCMPDDSFMGKQADLVPVFLAVCGRKPRTPGCEPAAGGLRGEALTTATADDAYLTQSIASPDRKISTATRPG